MTPTRRTPLLLLALTLASCAPHPPTSLSHHPPTSLPLPADVLTGLQNFYALTARPDGSFQNGVDPAYQGMSDSAYSDLAAITYACTLHKTFGWTLPHEKQTADFLLARQKPSGDFVNLAGTVDPASAEGRTYNTTQGLVALHALGLKPTYNPLPVFEEILKADYKTLPAFSTSFFPLAYLCYGQPIPPKADRGIRALMIQDATGYTNNHIAATFHASHYYSLVNEPTPKARSPTDPLLATASVDGTIKLWDAKAGVLLHTFEGHKSWVNALAFDPDGRYLLSGSSDGTLKVWWVTTRECVATFAAGNTEVRSVAISADGMTIAAGLRYGTLKVWHVTRVMSHGTDPKAPPATARQPETIKGLPGDAWAVAFTPDGKLIAGSGDWNQPGQVTVYNLANGATTKPVTATESGRFNHTGEVLSLSINSRTNKVAAAAGDGSIMIWELPK